MIGKTAVSFMKVKAHVAHGDLKDDWVLGAVIVNKSATKVSQKGSNYAIWTLSDLKIGLKTVVLFLFGQAYEKLWKTSLGTVVGILNPKVFANKENGREEATLSITNPDQIMVWGRSKDFGICKSKKKNGEDCGAFVNISQCEFCVYHIQSEYKKFTGRSELQSPTCGNMNSTKLRNKVLGKNEIFYGGKSFVASSKKHSTERDNKRLSNLGTSASIDSFTIQSHITTASSPISSRTTGLMEILNKRERIDHNRLVSLESKTAPTDTMKLAPKKNDSKLESRPCLTDPKLDIHVSTLSTSKSEPQKKSSRFQDILQENDSPINSKWLPKQHYPLSSNKSISKESKYFTEVSPILNSSNGSQTSKDENSLEKSKNITTFTNFSKTSKLKNSVSNAKLKALAYVKQKGKISKNDCQPNGRGVKRFLECDKVNTTVDDVSHNVFSERFIELMKMDTSHKNLVQLDEIIKESEYFDKMEKKEQLQEKMLTTYSLECKLVRCLQCKYTWFSASDACKTEHHSLKTFTGLKRFFKCTSCANRTVAVTFLPLLPCQKCGETKWERAAMINEKLVTNKEELCIRGGEEKFINSVGTNMNLNLLVPD